MRTLTINIPDIVDFDDKEALMAIASRLYEKGKLSIGQAAEIVGISKSSFMEMLSNYNVPIFNYPVEDLERDITNAKRNNS
jgi:predicted HTH domain antitoxin